MALTQVAGGMLAGSITSSQISSVAGSTITGSQSIPKSTLPTGTVLQMTFGNNTGTFNTSSSSLVTTGFSGTITPQFSTSKIMVQVNGLFSSAYNNNFGWGGIYRNGSFIGNNFFLGVCLSQNSGNRTGSQFFYQYLDSPATTSALTYTLYASVLDGNNIWVGRWAQDVNWAQPTQITLWEIAA
jgi:hypothetical protein